MKLLFLAACLTLATPVTAQVLPADVFAVSSPRPSSWSLQSTPRLVAGGLLGGAVGLAVGFVAAMTIASDADDDDYEALGRGVIGAAIGESVGLATGVHIANRRQGSQLLSSAASLAIGAAGTVLFANWEQAFPTGPLILSTTIIAQFVTVIAIQRRHEGGG